MLTNECNIWTFSTKQFAGGSNSVMSRILDSREISACRTDWSIVLSMWMRCFLCFYLHKVLIKSFVMKHSSNQISSRRIYENHLFFCVSLPLCLLSRLVDICFSLLSTYLKHNDESSFEVNRSHDLICHQWWWCMRSCFRSNFSPYTSMDRSEKA